MNIGVVGGGPAGLFFTYLMKRQDATHRIRVIERDPADATYGWGVVFTDIALAFVRDVAPELYAAMTRHQEVHDAMRIVHRGQAVALANNTFHRMARIDLLRTLRRYCTDLGVTIEFARKVESVDEFAGCDLIVAADGAASSIRTRYQEHFEPTIDLRPNFLAWYGTTCLFEPLSLIFREHGDGLLIAHTYRYSRTHSTFLVECDPETWCTAGLDRMAESESLAYCERVFRDDLDGHPLLSNKSEWFRYPIVRNRQWHWRNVVLLGDALRTVHFSIGSGTRMALQDAIALAEALQSHGDDVQAGLQEFWASRRPGSDDFQESAIKSILWYENVAEIFHLDPLAFAYSYFRRTGKMSHEDLRRMDPVFIAKYEATHGAP